MKRTGPGIDAIVDTGIPAAVDPATDLAAHAPGAERTWGDVIFLTSEVTAAGHDFGVLVETGNFPNLDKRALSVGEDDHAVGRPRRPA
jgi:hypothetical protein